MTVEFKNALAGISSLPAIDLTGYGARLDTRMDERLYLGWRVPCLGLTIFGGLDISVINSYSDIPIAKFARKYSIESHYCCARLSHGTNFSGL